MTNAPDRHPTQSNAETAGPPRPWREIQPQASALMDELDRARTPEAVRACIDKMAAPVTAANLDEALRFEEHRLGLAGQSGNLLRGLRLSIDELVEETATNAAAARRGAEQIQYLSIPNARSIPEVEAFTISCYTVDGAFDKLANATS